MTRVLGQKKSYATPENVFTFVERIAEYSLHPESQIHSLENAELLRTYIRIAQQTKGFKGVPKGDWRKLASSWAKRMQRLPWESVTVVENGQQVLRRFTHQAAEKYATANGLRLPTPYELARISESRGAKGIAESAYYDMEMAAGRVDTGRAAQPGVQLPTDEIAVNGRIYKKGPVDRETDAMIAQGYWPVYRPGQPKTVDFYFNKSGYVQPEGREWYRWFWSSSVHPEDSVSAYYLYGASGGIGYVRGYYFGALRGVRVRPRGP